MRFTLADVRFFFDRASGLVRRGMISLRTRGWRGSWARVKVQLQRVPTAQRAALYFPRDDAASSLSFPAHASPRASIVIPVYGQLAHTLRCLHALTAHPPHAAFEVIVIDDGSSDDTPQTLSAVRGLRFHRRAVNGGFIAACNDGATRACGEYLVFLNNDTVPQPGWLDALLDTFDAHPAAGVAGAQLVYPDGRLQEAGGVVFADGSAWNYGRFESPLDPRFAYLRDADYVSGAALAIRRALFETIGGFDARYAPAYYEDTDLAFAVREAGHRVVYQPSACVVHDEGTTAGTDAGAGVKAFQTRNRAVFAAHRAAALRAQPPSGVIPTPALLHRDRRQVLIVDEAVPRPDRDSASLRLRNLMQLLCDEGAHVVFLSASGEFADGYVQALQRLGIEVWYAPFIGRAAAWLQEHGPRFSAAVVCRHHLAREFLPLLRRRAPQATLVFDSVDLHYLRERRAAELAADRALLQRAERTRAHELETIARADVTLVVSAAERALLADDAPGARVEVVSNLHRVSGPGQPFTQRRDLVFVGGFRHPPNVDAVLWLANDILPALRARLPGVRVHCIGGDVPPAIAALSDQPDIVIHGHVPDIAPYMDGCRVALAPLRYGAGVKGKINLSMAHGQPVVATACAAEGMHLRDGYDVLLADTPERFAEAVARLYLEPSLWQTLSDHGLANVARHFSPEAARGAVRRVFFE